MLNQYLVRALDFNISAGLSLLKTNMTIQGAMSNDYEIECMEIAQYSEKAIKLQALWSYEHRKTKAALRVAREFFAANPKHMAKAVAMFPLMFRMDEERTLFEYLSAFKIVSLNKFEAALLAEQWQSHTMSFSEIRERVDSLKQRKPREKATKICPHCGGELT